MARDLAQLPLSARPYVEAQWNRVSEEDGGGSRFPPGEELEPGEVAASIEGAPGVDEVRFGGEI